MDEALCNETVTCIGCKREYESSEEDNYYNATNNKDGVCLKCVQARDRTLQSALPNPTLNS